eukprot:scaffold22457_cov47-Attheya_sp.AAC.6
MTDQNAQFGTHRGVPAGYTSPKTRGLEKKRNETVKASCTFYGSGSPQKPFSFIYYMYFSGGKVVNVHHRGKQYMYQPLSSQILALQ